MTMWPFQRMSRRKRTRSDIDDDLQRPLPSHVFDAPAAAVSGLSLSARQRSVHKKPHKLQRRRAYSFDLGRADNIEIGGGTARSDTVIIGHFYAAGTGNEHADAALRHKPTLRPPSKRKGSKRRKNTNDFEREAELKAMSRENVHHNGRNFTPFRPAAEPWSSGRVLRKETIKAHGSFRRRQGRDNEQHPSDVSLPLAESIDSAMSSDSEQIAYTVSPFAALAPKPTLRYAPTDSGTLLQRLPSQRRKLAQPISDAVLKAHKRVDDLADDLDAKGLRELLERDQRRRDRKRQRDQERIEQRLRQAQQAPGPSTSTNLDRGVLGRESAGLGRDTTSAVVTSSTRRHSAQTLISPPASPSASPQDFEYQPPAQAQKHQSFVSSATGTSVLEEDMIIDTVGQEDSASSSRPQRRRSPIQQFYRPESIPEGLNEFEPSPPTMAVGERKYPAPTPERRNSKLRRLITSRKRQSLGSSLEQSEKGGQPAESFSHKTSVASTAPGSLSWGTFAMLFRWRLKAKQSSGPSSFSNLSRDSMTAKAPPRMQAHARSHWQQHSLSQLPIQSHPPAAAVATERSAAPHPMKVGGGIPQRTLSRFREDLPDFLMSPPTSREASPEVEPVPPVPPVPEHISADEPNRTLYLGDEDDEPTVPTAVCVPQHESDQLRAQFSRDSNGAKASMRDTPTSWLRLDDKPSPEPEPQQDISLAFIDSEASWLSGRIAKRRVSGQNSAQVLNSLDSLTRSFPKPPQPQRSHRYRGSWASNETGETGEPPVSPVSFSMIPAVAASTTSDLEMTDDDMTGVVDGAYMHGVTRYSDTASVSTSAFRRNSGDVRQSSDEEDTARWGSVNQGQSATVVTLPAVSAMKSREVLTDFLNGDNGSGSDSIDSPVSLVSPVSLTGSDFLKDEDAGVQRATSVNLGKGHARHISAGSAKLLELTPHNLTDAKGQTDASM
ncbi:hypothetical protein CMQ_3927 [Grosmannia clavigera kw1407]|uniref:Uncharacterized protein n=1 Tax=Grosmannia clavigera (strain kw1407 / UAMH 11150) TaxID=655863 RepID=F0X8F0_GROCL|nr:uncharacterized protein CMQ_3927 [Grosmannia clavigera kw1407]EFX05858.1 hypothetical protein CMQ_3927 [Grosmannia clavigera kw1407]